jgi:hypothetical protein
MYCPVLNTSSRRKHNKAGLRLKIVKINILHAIYNNEIIYEKEKR